MLLSRKHGFRRGLSCETQMCLTYHNIAKLTESSSAVHAVELDFKKSLRQVSSQTASESPQKSPKCQPSNRKLKKRFLDS